MTIDPPAEPTTEPEPDEASDTDTSTGRRRPRPVPTLATAWGIPTEPVVCDDAEAASHWDVTLWHRGTPR